MTSSADTVISTENTCGEDMVCVFPLFLPFLQNRMVKQITNTCNGYALCHGLFSLSYKRSLQLQLPQKNADILIRALVLHMNSSSMIIFFRLIALDHQSQ